LNPSFGSELLILPPVFINDNAALSRDERLKKVMRYTSRVLNRNIEKVDFIIGGLQSLIDRVKRAEMEAAEEAKKRSRELPAVVRDYASMR